MVGDDAKLSDSPLQLLIELIPRGEVARYVSVASYVWLIYDWVLSSELEMKLIWTHGWTLGKWSAGAYLFVRWFGFALQTFEVYIIMNPQNSYDLCKNYANLTALGSLFLLFVVEVTLQARVYAMHRCDRRMLALNLVLYICDLCTTIYLFALLIPDILIFIPPHPLKGCWAQIPDNLYFTFLPSLAFEIWLWLQVVFKAFQHAKQYATDERKAVITLLFRDSIVWSIVIALMITANAIILRYAASGYDFIGIPLFQTTVCVGGSRLVLNIRQAYYSDHIHQAAPGASIILPTAYDMSAAAVLDYRRKPSYEPFQDSSCLIEGCDESMELHTKGTTTSSSTNGEESPHLALSRVQSRIDIKIEVQVEGRVG